MNAPVLDLRGESRVAFITGGASGLGRTAADLFATAGYRLFLADLDRETGEAAAEEIRAKGLTAQFVKVDVADSKQVERAIQTAVDAWGQLDFVFNNAGIVGKGDPIDELDETDLERVFDVDLKGPFLVCKHAVRAQKKLGGGSILNVASITALTGSAYFSAYGAAKAGVMALTRGLARNLGRFNIRINCLCPGSIAGTHLMDRQTRQMGPKRLRQQTLALMQKIPLGHPARPCDVAYFALFLASPLASHIHGAVLTIDGGESLGYH